ncbi:MAG: kelch repeat-containing protein [Polyangiaceae bacterium]
MRVVGSVEPVASESEGDPNGASREPLIETGIHRIGASIHFLRGSFFLAGGLGEGVGPEGDVIEYNLSSQRAIRRRWPLHTPRYLHAAIALSPTRILVIGGLTSSEQGLPATPSVERLDLEQGTSERLQDLPFATAEPQIARLPDGRILLAGGYDDEMELRTALLDTASGTWQSPAPLPSPRAGATPLLMAGHVLLIGGLRDFGAASAPSVLIATPDLAAWTEEPLEIPFGAAIAPLEQGTFLVAGGRSPDGSPLADVTLWTVNKQHVF